MSRVLLAACVATVCGTLMSGALVACGRTEPLQWHFDGGEDSDAGEADAGPVACIPGMLTLKRATPQAILVLDRSASMASQFGTTNRWRSLTSALRTVLPPVDQKMELGTLIFPSSASEACTVAPVPQLMPAFGQVDAILNLATNTIPAGHTPTADAITSAGAAILTVHAATGARALILATDGAPNCNTQLDWRTCTCADNICRASTECLDDTRTITRVKDLASVGIPTFVIGIQDTNAIDIATLNALAVAGGRPRAGTQSYYAVNSPSEMESALTTVRNLIGQCVFLTTSVPDDDGSIAITVDGVAVPYDPTGVNGWKWANRANGEIVINGGSCNTGAANPDSLVAATVVCSPPDAGVDAGVSDAGTHDGG